jgi:ribose-phosphate pyrophosphokinase
MEQDLIIFSGSANKPLAEKICSYLDVPLGEAIVEQFKDSETRIEIGNNVRGRDVFIVQPTSRPANHHIMEALIMADACRRASAQRLTLVLPYYGYARQERKSAPRTPISAKLAADLFTAAGFDRILTFELHTSAIQGFFNIPVDHLFAKPVYAQYFQEQENLMVVSPDAGGAERARAMAKLFNCGLAIIDKRREKPNESSVMNIIGDVRGKNTLLVDDICDTGGSLVKAAAALIENGALSVSAAISHAVFSGDALDKIEKSALQQVVITDSILVPSNVLKSKKIVQLSIAELLGKAIRRIHNSESVSSLFI